MPGPGQIGIGEGTSEWQTLWEVLIHEDERPRWSLFISCANLQVGDLKAGWECLRAAAEQLR